MDTKGVVLIANIGRRSVIDSENKDLTESQTIQKSLKINSNLDFKSITEKILEHWEDIEKYVALNILNRLIDKLIDERSYKIEKVYLFSSDQEGEFSKYRRQDTLYAGKIIKNLLMRDFKITSDDIIIKKKVVTPNKLIPAYRAALLEINKNHDKETLVICDSGGTPQQKSSLKIAAEYLLGNRCEYWQVIEEVDEDGSVLLGRQYGEPKPQEQDEYRKIIDNQQILLLIKKGEYAGAVDLRVDSPSTMNGDTVVRLLNFMAYRKRLIKHQARNSLLKHNYTGERLRRKGFSSLVNYSLRVPVCEKPERWSSHFRNQESHDDFFDLCEILAVAEFYLKLQDYSDALLNYHVFIEHFYNAFLTKYTSYDLLDPNRYQQNQRNLTRELRQMPHITNKFQNVFLSLAVKIHHTKHLIQRKGISDKHLHELIKSFDKCLKKEHKTNISDYRNDFAHKGKGVNKVNIERFIPEFEKWAKLMSFPEENIYFQINTEFANVLRLR